MRIEARRFAAPLFLFVCLLLGGSAQGIWANSFLRLASIVILAWAAISPSPGWNTPQVRRLTWLAGGLIVVPLLQFLPLPFSLWASLPGHARYATGFDLLGERPDWMSVSLAPYDSMATLLALLPPMAMLASLLAFKETSRNWLVVAMVGGAGAGVLLGILQVNSSDPSSSAWYLYPQSNFGVATGFFANGNHMAMLLLACIPFIAATCARLAGRSADPRKRIAILSMSVGALTLALIGLAINGSLAGQLLAIPVVMASLIIFVGGWSRRGRWLAAGLALAVAGTVALAWAYAPASLSRETASSIGSRQEIFRRSAELAAEFAPIGSGVGTFEQVYRGREDPGTVDRFYVNHAHNDYVEVAIETGLGGIALILLFLAWWSWTVRSNLGSPSVDRLAVAAAIASAAILLHSLVDYPLRTAALSTVFAMCIGLIATTRRDQRSDGELRPARHIVIA